MTACTILNSTVVMEDLDMTMVMIFFYSIFSFLNVFINNQFHTFELL